MTDLDYIKFTPKEIETIGLKSKSGVRALKKQHPDLAKSLWNWWQANINEFQDRKKQTSQPKLKFDYNDPRLIERRNVFFHDNGFDLEKFTKRYGKRSPKAVSSGSEPSSESNTEMELEEDTKKTPLKATTAEIKKTKSATAPITSKSKDPLFAQVQELQARVDVLEKRHGAVREILKLL